MKKLYLVRILLGLLILLNLWMIYSFSAEDAQTSGKTSEAVIRPMAQVVIKDFANKPQKEQASIISDLQLPVRKLAHMTEFGTLAMFILLFLRTWRLSLLSCFEWSMLSSILVALADELHQRLAESGRAGKLTDALIDLAGALIASLLVCLLLSLISRSKKKKRKQVRA